MDQDEGLGDWGVRKEVRSVSGLSTYPQIAVNISTEVGPSWLFFLPLAFPHLPSEFVSR